MDRLYDKENLAKYCWYTLSSQCLGGPYVILVTFSTLEIFHIKMVR
jgi:hypothetical protein